ncbi:MAG TPA: GNAT family N-acetyltransferase [Myxococcota bacterium]|nr:GNAT family N-acetyltransferase [Myxococcota bacterium]
MSAGELVLRHATMADLETLLRWDDEPHVIASDPNDDWIWRVELARTPSWREQLIAELDGRPIGVVQIIDPALEEDQYWGEVLAEPALSGRTLRAIDIWIGEADALGRGYGTRMMALALARCFAEPAVEAVLIDPLITNIDAQRFYRRIGFEDHGVRTFGLDVCLVMVLSRARHQEPSEA